jgi:mono/diheme cytochrome c family protein
MAPNSGFVRSIGRLVLVALAWAAAIAAVASSVAVASHAAPAGDIAGNTKIGRSTFVSTCGVCHALVAAKSRGVIGPDLDHVNLSEATIVKAITSGGASVMSKAAAAKYATRMTPYKGVLSASAIEDVAAFVYASTHTVGPTTTTRFIGAGHTPKVGVRWDYTVRMTAGGKPAAGKLTVQIVDPTGRAHPVQLGTSNKSVTDRHFTGSFSDFIVWPASARGESLTLRVTVAVGGGAPNIVSYKVKPRG